MSVTTMSCQGIRNESHDVVVEIPQSLKERCGLCSLLCVLGVLLIILSVIALLTSVVWTAVRMVEGCHIPPIALEDLSIPDMIVYQNNTSPDLQWQVKSDFSVTLRAWNTNTVAGSFSTYRRVVVYVEYHDTVILKREVPLGFGLKPRSSRLMVMEVNRDHFPVKKELGKLFQAELRIEIRVRLHICFHTWVMRNDRKAERIRMGTGEFFPSGWQSAFEELRVLRPKVLNLPVLVFKASRTSSVKSTSQMTTCKKHPRFLVT